MKTLRYGLAAMACVAVLWGAAHFVVPPHGLAGVKSNLRAISTQPRAPDIRRYLPILL